MWLSVNTQNTWITFDLGSVQTVGGFHLWNYNENTDLFRGVKNAGIYAGNSLLANDAPYASAGVAWGTLVENMTFTQATGQTSYAGESHTFTNPVTTRYLQIYVTSNFGPPDDDYTGISEIRFIGANIPATTITNVIRNPTTGEVTLTFTSSDSATYTVEVSTDLVGWTELDDSVDGQAAETSYTDSSFATDPAPNGKNRIFYRLTRN